MSKYVAVRRGLELGLAKLYMVKASCEGIYKAEEFSPAQAWFKGTAIICDDIIDHVEIALSFLEEISSNQEREPTAGPGEIQSDLPRDENPRTTWNL